MEAISTYKIDISTTGFTYDLDAYQKDSRVSLYHQGWSFEMAFIFLASKHVSMTSCNTNTFLMPFSISGWILIAALLVLV